MMWLCPKCGRNFKKENQSHYCGKAPRTVEEYISAQPEQVQEYLLKIHETLCEALPEVEACISWSMPTYRKQQNLLHFAKCKNHIGLYVGIEAVEQFHDKLKEYKTAKGTIQIPYHKPLPLGLIAEIAKWCYNIKNYS